MAEEIEQECAMKTVENFTEDETVDVPVPDVVKSDDLRVPGFLMCITQVIHYTKKGRDYVKCPRYPNEIVMIAIELMVHSDLAATRVPRALSSAWRPWLKQSHVQKYMQGKTMRPLRLAS